MAFQLDLPKFEALNAQVLGVSVNFNSVNKAWAEKLGVSYPLLSDMRRQMTQAYDVLYNDVTMAGNHKKVPLFLRAKRSWFVIDTKGVIRFKKVTSPRELLPNDEILQVLKQL